MPDGTGVKSLWLGCLGSQRSWTMPRADLTTLFRALRSRAEQLPYPAMMLPLRLLSMGEVSECALEPMESLLSCQFGLECNCHCYKDNEKQFSRSWQRKQTTPDCSYCSGEGGKQCTTGGVLKDAAGFPPGTANKYVTEGGQCGSNYPFRRPHHPLQVCPVL